ncbi:MAG: hypothetical protein WBQ25_00040 [Nitrososphaeraceae archaeon]
MTMPRIRTFKLNDDSVGVINIALRFLVRNGKTSDDIGIYR